MDSEQAPTGIEPVISCLRGKRFTTKLRSRIFGVFGAPIILVQKIFFVFFTLINEDRPLLINR